uniref:PirF Geranyltransferase n=1 Tax=Microcystis aeruginosa PCC 7005 TaxID=267870 RepID=UPI0011329F9C|nr:Chain A, PirF Geranyltransferase [Microcystis aeruginosa PCC 7005]6PGM_B Chain B, PirF Geranyltransferase [Microcystis aeruginosa PCC 7005]
MIVAEIQKNSLKEQRIKFIRNHQQAFDVEPIYPLRLFEDFVMSVEGDCSIEASCKIELDKLIASRFMLFFKDQEWEKYLTQSLAFFRQVENRVGVQLDYSLLQKFLGHNFDFSKLEVLSAGLDLRTNLADSSLKIHIRIKDYPEKINQALSLTIDGDDLTAVRDFLSVVGFDFYFDGRSAIEIYPEVKKEDFFKPKTQEKVWQHLPKFVLEPLQVTNLFGFGFSKTNHNPVVYYRLKGRQDLTNYFKINDTAQRVHSFYQHQDILPNMWVGTTQKELEKTRIENIRLYYYKSFKM